MKPVETFNVVPSLPDPLQPLRTITYNLRWAWNHDAIELFRRLDDELWTETGHNPARMLGAVDQEVLEAAADDDGFLAHMRRVSEELEAYRSEPSTWFAKAHPERDSALVAYFSAEFGLTDCLSIFAGGLGLLAGDHLKSASDLGLPLVAVGLLYQQGYFRQYLNDAGWQQEAYDENDFHNLPIEQVRRDGSELTLEIPCGSKSVTARVWRADVGRIALYLLDTNLYANDPADRDITDQLYGGGSEMRIKQEMVLGIGGHRLLHALGVDPSIYHMNEGHSAFLALERIRHLMDDLDLSFDAARELASSGLVFTTHTPVPAGHDAFDPDQVDRHLGEYVEGLGLSRRAFLDLGQARTGGEGEPFNMTVLALRMAGKSNAVSRLHGRVTREMWEDLWPGVPTDEIPITYVTNGVHVRSWISEEMNQLYDRYLSPRWREEPAARSVWKRVERIPDEELWRTHEQRRARLVSFARRRLRRHLERRGAPRREIERSDEILDADTLTVGFGRRFATYKRADLIKRDTERLANLVSDANRPLQILFAGKAHPKDEAGKELIREIVDLSRRSPFEGRIVFLENFDMETARFLVQGVDVWLNTPRRPREASGTSGMKAAANGALNLSTMDGWWAEAWNEVGSETGHGFGWAIGRGETYDDPDEQDRIEAEALYELLENEVVPTFYDRDGNGPPRTWIEQMKTSIGHLCPFFNTHRMVRSYAERLYVPAEKRYRRLVENGGSRARELAVWKRRVRENWSEVAVEAVRGDDLTSLEVGSTVEVRAQIRLGALMPEDVRVEIYLGRLDAEREITDGSAETMTHADQLENEEHLFEAAAVPCRRSGLHGYTVRIVPDHPDLVHSFLPELITWAPSTSGKLGS